jgi:hypothetical protein
VIEVLVQMFPSEPPQEVGAVWRVDEWPGRTIGDIPGKIQSALLDAGMRQQSCIVVGQSSVQVLRAAAILAAGFSDWVRRT